MGKRHNMTVAGRRLLAGLRQVRRQIQEPNYWEKPFWAQTRAQWFWTSAATYPTELGKQADAKLAKAWDRWTQYLPKGWRKDRGSSQINADGNLTGYIGGGIDWPGNYQIKRPSERQIAEWERWQQACDEWQAGRFAPNGRDLYNARYPDHAEIVTDALKQGLPVPAEVLIDYPELRELATQA